MDNENTVLTGQGETAETSTDFDAVFESGWEDDGPQQAEEETVEVAGEGEDTEAEADQQNAEGSDGEESDGASQEEGESEGDEGEPDQASTFTLRHLGEERTVDREEVITLAQKGMDYDRIREKWDAVKDDVSRLRMYEGFLKELAEARGGDIDSLIDETRVRAMMARAEAKGEKLDPAAAAAEAVKARLQFTVPEPEEKAPEEQNRDAIDAFLKVYGTTVDSKDIPKEVWDEAEKAGDLIGPYQRYVNRKLEEDNKKLREELEAVKKQQKNRARSTGSSKTVGAGIAADPFDEGWSL